MGLQCDIEVGNISPLHSSCGLNGKWCRGRLGNVSFMTDGHLYYYGKAFFNFNQKKRIYIVKHTLIRVVS